MTHADEDLAVAVLRELQNLSRMDKIRILGRVLAVILAESDEVQAQASCLSMRLGLPDHAVMRA
jgi:hypothetical protein